MSWSETIALPAPPRAVLLARPAVLRAAELEARLATAREEGFARGYAEARQFYEQQLAESRALIHQMRDEQARGTVETLANLEKRISTALPELALDIARQILAGYEPPAELLQAICRQSLDQMFPERAGLELVLGPRDAELLQAQPPAWRSAYPGLKITADPVLQPGECVVRSRFGVVDGRRETRLAALRESLTQP